jgi:hypothetical protein
MSRARKARHATGLSVLFALLLLFSLAGCDSGDGNKGNDKDSDVISGDDGGTPSGADVQGAEDVAAGDPDQATSDVCVPACAGKTCGDDGCGGSCCNCFTMEGSLNNDLCQEDGTCLACGCAEGQECGNDPCGSPCGTCPGSFVCNDANTCDPPPINCDYTGFHSVEDYAKANKDSGGGFTMHYQGVTTASMPFDVLVIDIDTNQGGPTGPGIYDLAYNSFEEGGLYVYVLQGWNGNGYDYLFAPTEGTLEILSLSSDGGKFEAVLHKGVLEQGTYDGATNAPKFVAHGEIWCMDNIKINTDLLVTQDYCVEGGTGYSIGDNIGDFSLQRCDGQWVSLHSMCEVYKAIWIVGTAGW